MSAAIIPFVGIATQTARENLVAFIEHAKSQRFFRGPHAISWSSNTWDFRPFIGSRGQNPPGRVIHFTTYETTRRGNRSPDAAFFDAPYLDAAKALIADFLVTSGVATPSKLLTAIRVVEKAFRDLGLPPDICGLTPHVLDRAAEIVQANLQQKWDYGRFLERLALEIVNPARLSASHLLWKSPFLYQGARRNDRVNREGGAGEMTDKLPHLKAIVDLAGVFHSSNYVPDIVITAWFALAMFSPSRVNEILTLPLDCQTQMDGVFGISWRPLKGGAPMTKFATTDEWADVACEAVKRLRELGSKCRIAARWYAENPGRLYLPPGWEHLRGQPMTLWEVQQIIGKASPMPQGLRIRRMLESASFTTDLTRTAPIEPGTGTPRWLKLFTYESVERSVVAFLPPPLADERHGIETGQALFCLPRHIMRGDGDTLEFVPELISYAQIKHELGSKPTGLTIFERHGLLDPTTGQHWKLNTHQPRHLLNSLAQSKHLSEALVAFWSGRKRVDQNAWYDHVPQEAFIEAFVRMGQSAPKEIRVVGPLEDKVAERARKEMISHDDALRLELGSIISTRYGVCRHNYALTPCPKDKNCIGCGENTFIKGDARQLAEARKQQAISAQAVRNCRLAIEDGEPDVEKWLSKHEDAEKRWSLAVERLTDLKIPDGTLITLPQPRVSQTKTGLSVAIRTAEAGNVEFDDIDDGDDFGGELALAGAI